MTKTIPTMLTGMVLLGISQSATAQNDTDKHFHGIYLGSEIGSQNLFGGALINGADILTEDKRFVASGFIGARYQFESGLVLGFEGQVGATDGDLTFSDTAQGLTIGYENNSQSAYGLTLGYAFGEHKDWLLFAYGLETSRDFDVTITGPLGTGTQNDNQGMVRYGVGLEKAIGSGLHIRAAVGSLAADFGDTNTNIDVEGKLEATIGILFQF
ncbi:MAG: outer membrane beta-barrel protein [Kordiimonadaceae bacterium]|nr:outer membrane beta-barrel protein [Kordiimonadaceae bacterium]MBO6569649.1 outer membrane beta-barrel protein [Kordiimonadaceae bacterium]MBO6966184.1 outer membrane beta-barrel protein [Kordiimonadaceae bacterium]